MDDRSFRARILGFWRRHGRHGLPWRATADPYAILVSEVMLQQTQVPRVINKYQEFLRAFPTFRALARAPRSRLLRVWQGLGYNRRALNLQRCAKEVVGSGGKLPRTYDELRNLPGIGPYTAGAVLAFAFNLPHAVVETNIRRVYLHHFFPKRRNVPDSAILPLVIRHLSFVISPREWYSALMDYGAHLAAERVNPNRRSRHYSRQPAFRGSLRQLRGRIVRLVLERGPMLPGALAKACDGDARVTAAVTALVGEGFLVRSGGRIRCA
jgi:A/G-specific adenine glycosylase